MELTKLLLISGVIFSSVLVQTADGKPKPCKKACDDDSWTQTVKEAEDSVYGDTSFFCHSCINNCISEKALEFFGKDFDMYKADCEKRNEYYKWHFGTGMPDCMEEIGPGKCLEQMKFSCGYDYKNMIKTSGKESCNWPQNCEKWGFDNSKFMPEDANWQPYTDDKRKKREIRINNNSTFISNISELIQE